MLTNYAEAQALTDLFTGSYVSLASAVSDAEAGTVTEIAVTRQALTFDAPAGGALTNNAEISFGDIEIDTTATHLLIYDAATSGNLLAVIDITDTAIQEGLVDTATIAAGDLDLTLD